MPWADVKKEMTQEKGLDEAVADKIGQYVGWKGESPCHTIESLLRSGPGKEVLAKLEADAGLMSVPSAKAGLEDMRLLLEYLEVYGVLDKVS